MLIRYERAPRDAAHWRALAERLVARKKPRRVCDLGGGANPALSPELVARHQIDYLVVDVSAEELEKAPQPYNKLVADLEVGNFEPPGEYDLALSISVAEHISTPMTFHRNVYRLLAPGGRAFHFFPTLYSLPFVANRVLPEQIAEWLLRRVQPGREQAGRGKKFPALYRWCRGPTSHQIRRFERLGFEVEEYVGYFGHGYYARVPPLQALEDRFASLLVRRPLPLFTSYASVLLRRPG